MKNWGRVTCISVLFLAVVSVTSAFSATLEWDRNAETDMKDYQVWACFTLNCVVVKNSGNLQPGTVVQPAVGVKPTYTIDLIDKEGSVAVSARDLTLNESGLSVAVPFDKKAPSTPTNAVLK